MPVINNFHGDMYFLSNFFPVTVLYEGYYYPSVECAYQAAKTVEKADRSPFMSYTSGMAKREGKKLTLRPYWDTIKLPVMWELLNQKFNSRTHFDNYEKLINTKGYDLVEGNSWNDTFYGVCNGVGENHLGKMLMVIRDR